MHHHVWSGQLWRQIFWRKCRAGQTSVTFLNFPSHSFIISASATLKSDWQNGQEGTESLFFILFVSSDHPSFSLRLIYGDVLNWSWRINYLINSLYSIMSNQEKPSSCFSQSKKKVVPLLPLLPPALPVYSWWWWWRDWRWMRQSFDWQVPRLAQSQPGLTFNSFIKKKCCSPAWPVYDGEHFLARCAALSLSLSLSLHSYIVCICSTEWADGIRQSSARPRLVFCSKLFIWSPHRFPLQHENWPWRLGWACSDFTVKRREQVMCGSSSSAVQPAPLKLFTEQSRAVFRKYSVSQPCRSSSAENAC